MRQLLKQQILCFILTAYGFGLLAQTKVINQKIKTFTNSCRNVDRSKQSEDIPKAWTDIDNNAASINHIPHDASEEVGSYVNSLSKSYIDIINESAQVNAYPQSVKQLHLTRNYASRRAHRVWDLGLGQATNLDYRLTLSVERDNSLTIYQEMPRADFAPLYVDGSRGDKRDGIFHGAQQNHNVEIHLLDASDNIVLNFADAVKIRYIDFKFNTYEYQVIKIGESEYAGRLTSLKDLKGHGFTISYKNFTAAEIGIDPALQWQKESATDSSGRTFRFAYRADSIGGEYVISAITLPNASIINYEYTDTYLSKVTYPDSSTSTYSYSVDTDGDTVYTSEETNGKIKEIYLSSNSTLVSNHTGQILWNQNSMGTGTVKVNGEISYAHYQHPRVGNYAYVYTGENQMKFRHIDRLVRYFTGAFNFDSSRGYYSISGTREGQFLNRRYQNPNGIEYPSYLTNEKGQRAWLLYDKLNRLVFKSYANQTFESWSYNDLNLETRYRDTSGRVTLKTYDDQGNLLSREIGLFDSYTGRAIDYNNQYRSSKNLTQVRGAKASQSSTGWGGHARKGIDTNTNGQYNMYSVTHTRKDSQAWWKVQLARASTVNTVKIYNRKAAPQRLTDFTLTLSHGDTIVYQQVFADPVDSQGIVEVNLPTGITADCVKVQLNGTNYLSLAEVEVFGSDPVIDAEEFIDTTQGNVNLTQISGTEATQSSTGWGGHSARAIDGNTNGQYRRRSVTHTKKDSQAWWKVQLVRPSKVNIVKIYNRKEVPGRLANFTVILNDGEDEVYREVFIDPVASSGIVEINLPSGTMADSVTVQLNGTNYLSLAEVEVLGSDPTLDVNTTYINEYYPEGHANQYLLRYSFDAENQRTEYLYNSNHQLTQINKPDGTQESMTYSNSGLLQSSTDLNGQTTHFEYDQQDRKIKTTYADGTTELNIYGSGLNAALIIKTKDRQGSVTKFEYDSAARVTLKTRNYSIMNADGTTETVNPDNQQVVTKTTYLTGQTVPRTVDEDGYIREYTYDHRLRVLQTTTLAHSVKFSAGENGIVSGKVKQSIVPSQDSLPVTAIPNSNYYFVSWSDGNTDNPRVLTNVTADKNLTATFTINTYTLAFTAGENGTITGNANQTINHGANSTAITATPNTEYHFVSWSDGNTDNPRTLTNVTENKTLTATFAINTYTLAFTAGENGTISGDLNQTINHGANSTAVTATPNTGYHFVSWSDGNTSATRILTNVTTNKTLTATFAINTYTLAFTAEDNGTIIGDLNQTINHGANSSSVNATPNSGYQFEKWSDNSTNNPRTITNVTANQNLSASFKIIEQTPISGIFFSQEFEHDQLNRRNKVTQLDQSKWNLTYDSKSNLKSALKVDVDTNQVYYFQYTYDDIGNRITKNQDGVTVQYTANALNQYTSIIRDGVTETQQYDADANPLNIRQWVMTWDFENRMTSCTDQANDTRLEFAYSFDHMRAWKKVIINGQTVEWIGFVYKGRLLIAEIDLLNERKPIRTYTWGLDPAGTQQQVGGIGALLSMDAYQPDGSKKHYRFINDASGNIVKVLEMHDDDTITVANSYEYGPFGQVIAKSETIENPFQFQTKYYDKETGFNYYGYRYYDPVDGRWVNRDPIGIAGGINTYNSVSNNMVNGFSGGMGYTRGMSLDVGDFRKSAGVDPWGLRTNMGEAFPGSPWAPGGNYYTPPNNNRGPFFDLWAIWSRGGGKYKLSLESVKAIWAGAHKIEYESAKANIEIEFKRLKGKYVCTAIKKIESFGSYADAWELGGHTGHIQIQLCRCGVDNREEWKVSFQVTDQWDFDEYEKNKGSKEYASNIIGMIMKPLALTNIFKYSGPVKVTSEVYTFREKF